MAQKCAGNTNSALMTAEDQARTRMRNACWTWNNPDDVERITEKLRAWKGVSYLVFGEEIGEEEGTPHLQGYTEFTNPKDFSAIHKMLEGSHLEARRGTAKDASNYCKKGEQTKKEWADCKDKGPNWGLNAQVTEWGTLSEQGNRNDLSPACDMIKTGHSMRDVAIAHPETYVKYHKGLMSLKCILVEPRDVIPEIRVYYGSTGTWKSRSAREWLGSAKSDDPPFIWHPQCEKWFDGYEGQKKVIFEEFRGQLPFGFLLSLTDRYDCKVQYKGGMIEFCATQICFTSPIHPNEWYKLEDLHGKEKLNQLTRRITDVIDTDEQSKKRKFIETMET